MRNKVKEVFIITFIAVILFCSCEKNSQFPTTSNTPLKDFSEIFDIFWNGVNKNYVYWDIDTTEWDAIYSKYKPIFSSLDLNSDTDIVKSIAYFREMTQGLIDGHFNISFLNKAVLDSNLYPAYAKKLLNPNFHGLFPYTYLSQKYLDSGYVTATDSVTNNQFLFAVCGTIKKSMLYFSCNKFSFYRSYYSQRPNAIQALLKYYFNLLHNIPVDIKGIIIDLRGNSGGDLSDLNFFVGQFISKPLNFGFTKYKSGNGRLEFTPWIPAIIQPQPEAHELNVPIIVLADNYSASLSEAITIAIHSLPNGIVVGENTYGATGPITKNDVYNDGSFEIKNFMTIETSSAAFRDTNDKTYEGTGFPPDIFVPFDIEALNSGIDKQLEKAISIIE